MNEEEIQRLCQERDALEKAVTVLLAAKKEKAENGKTEAYHNLAASGWQLAEDAVYFIQTR